MRIRMITVGAVLMLALGAARIPPAPESDPSALDSIEISVASLRAQQSAAVSAHAMIAPTYLQMLLSLGATLGLFATIYYTRRSLALTRESLELTRTEVENQGVRNRRELRAYVSAKPIEVQDMQVGEKPVVRVRIANSGVTPASDVYLFSQFGWAKNNGQVSGINVIKTGPLHLGAGSDDRLGCRLSDPLTLDDLDFIKNVRNDGSHRLLVVAGIVKYVDVFDQTHETCFGYTLDRDGNATILEGMNSAT